MKLKPRGCSVIFINSDEQVLLYLRDDKPGLPEAGKWDLLGGQVELGETPTAAIKREIQEEIAVKGVDIASFLGGLQAFKTYALASPPN